MDDLQRLLAEEMISRNSKAGKDAARDSLQRDSLPVQLQELTASKIASMQWHKRY
jgi:hypothetical protein